MKITKLVFLAFTTLILAACGNQSPTSETTAAAAAKAEPAPAIAWFEGTLDAAFEQAKRMNKPVFVFWSAQWCPYCQSVKSTVFTRADFIRQSQDVIPVEMDGDLPEAQKWGAQFKVVGYPTLLIFRPDRTEIARVSGGMDLDQYAAVLANVVKDERPIAEVLEAANTPAIGISADDCRRLAYYGWDLTEEVSGAELNQRVGQLSQAADRCAKADPVSSTRLSLHALATALTSESEGLESGKAASRDVVARVQKLGALFEDEGQTAGNMDILSSLDSSLYKVVAAQGKTFSEDFRKEWTTALRRAADDPHYGESERLIALATAIDAEKELGADHKIPPGMADDARARVRAVLEVGGKGGSRNDIINAARIMYSVLDDDDSLYQMLIAEIPNSATPYYYMPTLAAIEEKRGHADKALGWLEKAYAATNSPGAKAKWGTKYVNGLVRLAPDDIEKIESTALQVADAMKERDSLLAGSAQGAKAQRQERTASLTKPLTKWAITPDRKAVAASVEKRLAS